MHQCSAAPCHDRDVLRYCHRSPSRCAPVPTNDKATSPIPFNHTHSFSCYTRYRFIRLTLTCSDCGVQAPEKFIFRIGFITTAPLLVLTACLVRDYISTRARCLDSRGYTVIALHAFFFQKMTISRPFVPQDLTFRLCGAACEDVSVIVMTVASACLALLAAVSEEENSDVCFVTGPPHLGLTCLISCPCGFSL